MKILLWFFNLGYRQAYPFACMIMYLIFCIPADVSSTGTSSQVPDSSKVIKSAFDPKTATWNIEWPGRVSQYDLVYLTPPHDPMEGIPLGNGDVGALFWCEDSKLIAVVNKSDLWDDAKFSPFLNWNRKEEDYNTTQRHACRIIIDFKFPVFNVMYLSGFKAKLNLADASISIESTSAFGKVSFKAFVDHKTGVLFYDLDSDLNEDVPVNITVERFGSRTFSHWYNQINRDVSIGLAGTEVIADNNGTFITQKLTSGTFAVGSKLIQSNGLKVNYSREHSRRALIELSGNRQKRAQLAFSVTSPSDSDPVSIVKNTLSSVSDQGIEPFKRSQAETWKSIWTRSFIDYGDDYLCSLWHLTMFYANASQGGKYPGRFNNGLWGWNSDVQQWNFYFHWNQQQSYWPLNAAGFHELVNPYLDFRFNSLPGAKKDAKEYFKSDGAFISDVVDGHGNNSSEGGGDGNHTPVAAIALDFWRQYQYTGDEKFLKDKALPFIIEAARFFESRLVKEDDGLYHARESTGYEGWVKLKDGLPELVYSNSLFTTALKALKAAKTDLPEAAKWNEILDHLAPLPVVTTDVTTIAGEVGNYKINRGFFRGEASPTNKIFAAGWGIKDKKWLTTFNPVDENGLTGQEGIFPAVPMSPVYPTGLIGLGQKGSILFDVMTATTLLYGSEVMGWDPVPIAMARMGLANELAANLDQFPQKWQISSNGWGHISDVQKEDEQYFRTSLVSDISGPETEKFPIPTWPFRHMSMESMSILATAINESMFQSYDNILRIAPAFPANRTGRFTLHATGGFVVSSEIKSGKVQWICIKSLYGNPCKIELPWSNGVAQSNLKNKSQLLNGKIAEIKTKPNEVIMILPEGKNLQSWSVVNEKPLDNEKVRYHSSGKVQLGIPRMF